MPAGAGLVYRVPDRNSVITMNLELMRSDSTALAPGHRAICSFSAAPALVALPAVSLTARRGTGEAGEGLA